MRVLATLCSIATLAAGVTARVVAEYMQDCWGHYVDGIIYVTPNSPEVLPAEVPGKNKFRLAILPSKDESESLWSTHSLARSEGDAHWTVFDDVLYINSSPGAYEPVGFNNPKELRGGQTHKYWGMSYGASWWAPKDVPDAMSLYGGPGGFVHQPVEGFDNVFKLYWNQTQFEEFAAGRLSNVVLPWFPLCWSFDIASIGYKNTP